VSSLLQKYVTTQSINLIEGSLNIVIQNIWVFDTLFTAGHTSSKTNGLMSGSVTIFQLNMLQFSICQYFIDLE